MKENPNENIANSKEISKISMAIFLSIAIFRSRVPSSAADSFLSRLCVESSPPTRTAP